MGVYYYIVNRTLRQRIKKHYGKWGEFVFEDEVEDLFGNVEGWSEDHDIWAVGDDRSNAVKYYPRKNLPEDKMKEAMTQYKEV